jgi:site-specific DNA-methyltransferase (adenine-specific)
MSILLHGDCLNEMKSMEDDSVDLIFCDLPYGQTNCKWDCKIDLQKFWIEVMRIKKINTPIFFTTTTKFGVELINTAPKKCPFRYDIVWVKSAPAGFLSAKKMPLRKHELIYVFYEKLPFYDLSSHKHKFLKDPQPKIIKDTKHGTNTYDTEKRKKPILRLSDQAQYDPPLPTSVVKDIDEKYKNKGGLYSNVSRNGLVKNEPHYDPPLPTSMLEIKSTRGKHSTEKPIALMEWILKYYSKEDDIVLDPTMGSGSTGVACKNMKRNFIGIEMDPEIYEVAVNRIES